LDDGTLEQLIDELLEHRADPYSVVEGVVAEALGMGTRG
jgi:hypothetical protein